MQHGADGHAAEQGGQEEEEEEEDESYLPPPEPPRAPKASLYKSLKETLKLDLDDGPALDMEDDKVQPMQPSPRCACC